MKILKPGREQKGWATEATCTGMGNGNGGCGAVLLVEEPDLFQTSRHSYGDEFPEYFATFECVACGVLTDLRNYPLRAAELPKRSAKWCAQCSGKGVRWIDDNAGGNCSQDRCPDCKGSGRVPI